MPDDLRDRIRSLEEYQALFYKWIDEIRSWTQELRAARVEHEAWMRKHEIENAEELHALRLLAERSERTLLRQDERIRLSEEGIVRIEEGLRDSRELIRAQQLMHGGLLKLLSYFRERQDDHDGRLSAAGI